MWVTTVTHKEVEVFMLSLTLQAQASCCESYTAL